MPTGTGQRDREETGLGFRAGSGGVACLCAGVLCGEAERNGKATQKRDVSVNGSEEPTRATYHDFRGLPQTAVHVPHSSAWQSRSH